MMNKKDTSSETTEAHTQGNTNSVPPLSLEGEEGANSSITDCIDKTHIGKEKGTIAVLEHNSQHPTAAETNSLEEKPEDISPVSTTTDTSRDTRAADMCSTRENLPELVQEVDDRSLSSSYSEDYDETDNGSTYYQRIHELETTSSSERSSESMDVPVPPRRSQRKKAISWSDISGGGDLCEYFSVPRTSPNRGQEFAANSLNRYVSESPSTSSLLYYHHCTSYMVPSAAMAPRPKESIHQQQLPRTTNATSSWSSPTAVNPVFAKLLKQQQQPSYDVRTATAPTRSMNTAAVGASSFVRRSTSAPLLTSQFSTVPL